MILIKGGRVIDPERGIDMVQDVVLDGGVIKAVGNLGDEKNGSGNSDGAGQCRRRMDDAGQCEQEIDDIGQYGR